MQASIHIFYEKLFKSSKKKKKKKKKKTLFHVHVSGPTENHKLATLAIFSSSVHFKLSEKVPSRLNLAEIVPILTSA